MVNFKFLTSEEEKNCSYNELLCYYEQLRDYYKNLSKYKFNVRFREKIHPYLLLLVEKIRNINLKVIGKENLEDNETVIFAINHSNSHDFPIISEVIQKHFYILADYTMKKTIVNIPNQLNGVVYVDRLNKQSRIQSKEMLLKLLTNNTNVLMFPEGTWNLTDSKILLPLNWGIIDLAKISSCPIIPIILDYRLNLDTKKLSCIASVGEKITIDKNIDKKDGINILSDSMATIRWNIWERYPIQSRKEIELNYNDVYVKYCLNEYKKFDLEYENSVILDSSLDKEKLKKKF